MSENINNLAFSFFSGLVICSILSDSYIILNNFLKNNYIKKKINYFKNIYKIIIGLTLNSFKNDDNGNIIIEESENKSTNPFDEDYDDSLDNLLEKINELDTNIRNNEEILKLEQINDLDTNIINEDIINEDIINEDIINKDIINEDIINEINNNIMNDEQNNELDTNIINEEIIIDSKQEIIDEKIKETINSANDVKLTNNNENIIFKQISPKKIKIKKNIEEVIKKKSKKV
jgi:hypothetical protein